MLGTPPASPPRALAGTEYQNLDNEATVELREKVIFKCVCDQRKKVEKNGKSRVF